MEGDEAGDVDYVSVMGGGNVVAVGGLGLTGEHVCTYIAAQRKNCGEVYLEDLTRQHLYSMVALTGHGKCTSSQSSSGNT